jgi:hypothetical protein
VKVDQARMSRIQEEVSAGLLPPDGG